jgi:three-Cys-motif partner protein
MPKNKQETKENVFEHSRAKLEFYENYLKLYLIVLLNDSYTDTINIYDIFCGIGIYEDGNEGSPIIAIKNIETLLEIERYSTKNINLIINDIKKYKVDFVKKYIDEHHKNRCEIDAYNLDAIEMLKIVNQKIYNSQRGIKNLIFIDPYGYKEVYKRDIFNIMNSKNSEIIIFLPISQMYRFSKSALQDRKNKSYKHLRRFIEDFFEVGHPIYKETYDNQLQYIEYIKNAFSFNKEYYSASYHIQRQKKDYYALFFITNHIYGLEKILKTKWELDNLCGKGFKKTKKQTSLFDEVDKEEEKENCFDKFQFNLRNFLQEYRTNIDLYEFTLKSGFLPKHTTKILKKENLIFDREVRKNSFYIGYKEYYKKENIKYKVRIK